MAKEKRLTPKQKKTIRELSKKNNHDSKNARLLSRPEFTDHLPRTFSPPPESNKTPRSVNNPNSIMSCYLDWCQSKADIHGEWSWGQSRQWDPDHWSEIIHPKMCEFQKLTWSELFAQRTGGRLRHKMHHNMDVCELTPEAFDRWCEIGLEEYDTAFRFRVGNKPRLWGYRIHAKFFLIWWDPNHLIYPTEVK